MGVADAEPGGTGHGPKPAGQKPAPASTVVKLSVVAAEDLEEPVY